VTDTDRPASGDQKRPAPLPADVRALIVERLAAALAAAWRAQQEEQKKTA
jgi:hypothetical protein